MEIYDFKLPDGQGNIIDFALLKEKVVIIVNVASLCGFAPQYNDLQYLYDKYHNQGLEIIAFPCNQFARQEPLSDKQITEDARKRFGVKFPIMSKIMVNGRDECGLYTLLKKSKLNEFAFRGVKWNFEKFVVSRKGEVVARYPSAVNPREFDGIIKSLLESGSSLTNESV